MKVVVTDRIAREGIDYLRRYAQVDERYGLSAEQLIEIIGDYAALVVRSETRVTAAIIKAGRQLKIIGRAGIGVDNIDLDAATQQGIIVVNSPTGNLISAAEHTIALLLGLARLVPQAHASLKEGKWERSKFTGVEVRNKTLGIVGLGKVGTAVAKRAIGLEMRVIASDPFAAKEHAQKLGIELLPLETLLQRADFITLHTSLTASTLGLIGAKELALCKPTARFINVARGGVIDEMALLKALDEDQLAGAALDVFSKEPPGDNPLLTHPKIIVTPHLGASTEEAQITVALDVAEQIAEVLNGGSPRAAVNAPLILPETLRILQPYMHLVEQMGRLYTQLHPNRLSSVEITYSGEITDYDLKPLKAALIKGLLESVSEVHVNMVNAGLVARQWGLEVSERHTPAVENFTTLVTLRVRTNGSEHTIAGTVVHDEYQIVRVDKFWGVHFQPQGNLLFCHHLDQPGMIGRVGTILGNADVNIAHMDQGRTSRRGEALMVLSLDEPMPETTLDEIRQIPHVYNLNVVKL